MKTNLLLIGIIILLIGIFTQLLKETPNERVERIDRMANLECNTGNQEYDRNCYSFYYSQIEDRD